MLFHRRSLRLWHPRIFKLSYLGVSIKVSYG
jgi:hypothetical protein